MLRRDGRVLRAEIYDRLHPLRRVELRGPKRRGVVRAASSVRRFLRPVLRVAPRVAVLRKRRHVEVDQRHHLVVLVR